MAIAGSLEVQMFANIARFTADMNQVKSIAGSTMATVERAVGAAKSALGALGVGLGVGYFVSLIKGSIDAMDHINDLSKATKISVENLAGLKLAATQSGGDLDSIAASINKLAQNMGKDAEKFKALGISAKDPLEAFRQLSDIFNAIEDPQTRAALGAATLGKSWAGAAPLLSEGSKKIGEMVEKGKTLSGMTSAMGESADQLKDRIDELNTVMEASKAKFASGLVGPLTDATRAITDAYVESGKLMAVWVSLGALGSFLFTDDGLTRMQKLNKDINSLTKEFNMLAVAKADADAAAWGGWFSDKLSTDINRVTAQMSDLRLERTLLLGEQAKAVQAAKDEAKATLEANAAASAENTRKVKAFIDNGTAAKALKDELARLQTVYEKITNKDSGLSGSFTKDLLDLHALFGRGKIDVDQYRKAVEALLNQQPFVTDQVKAMVKAFDDAFDAVEKERLGLEAQIKSGRELTEGMEFEVSLIGKSNTEREMAIKLRELENAGIKKGSQAYDEFVPRIRDAIDGMEAARVAQQELQAQTNLWDTVGNKFGDFISAFTGGWKSGMDYARSALKSLLADLVAFFAKRWLLSVVAGGSGTFGSTAASAAGSALGSMGNSLIGTGLSALGGTIGSSLFGSAATTGVSAAFGGAAGIGLEGAAATSGLLGSGGIAGIGSSISSALAAIPVWGWIAVAALAAFAYFGGKGGGPKSGGSAQFTVGPDGSFTDTSASFTAPYHTSGENLSSTVAPIAEATAKSFAAMFKSLGGAGSSKFSFGQGFDTDPAGTASNRVATQAFIDGVKIFEQRNDNLGRDAKDIAPELQLQAGRALLAALQASKLQKEIADILDSVSATSASQEQLTDVLARAQAMHDLFGEMGIAMNTALTPMRSAIELIADQGKALADFARDSDRSAKSLADLTIGTAQFRANVSALIAQYAEAKTTIGATIADAIRNLTFGTLDKAGQYAMLQSEAQALKNNLGGMTDAALIASTISQIVGLSNQAFGFLDPAAQKAQLADFIIGLKDTQLVADTRLADLQQAAVDAANQALAETRANLDRDRETAQMNRETALIERDTANINAATAARGVQINVGGGTAAQVGA